MNHDLAAGNEARLPNWHGSRTPPRTDHRFFVRYHTLLMAVALGAMYANLPVYLYVLDTRLLPKFIYFGIFAFIAPLMAIRWQALGDYLVSPFALWALLLFSLNMIHLAGFPASADVGGAAFMDMHAEARRSLITTRAQYILFALFLGFVAYISPARMYLRIMFVLMAVVPCAVIVDFANPGLLYPVDVTGAVLGRAAAMFINPNLAGEAILHIVVLGFAVLDRRYRMPLFLLAGIAILTTFSRAAIIAWMVLLGLFIYKRTLPKSAVISLSIAIGILLVFIGSFESYISSREEFEDAATNILSRLNFFSSFTFDDDSSEERAGVIQAGWELFLQNPLFGSGAGATHFWRHRGSTHNQLLLLAAEYGVMGILLWGWMLIMLCKSRFFSDPGLRYAMAFLFAFMSMFTHQMLDAASYWLATFALVCATPGSAPAGSLTPGLWPRQRMARAR
jgi:O-antigen ligase